MAALALESTRVDLAANDADRSLQSADRDTIFFEKPLYEATAKYFWLFA
jgi:hypothetical protein